MNKAIECLTKSMFWTDFKDWFKSSYPTDDLKVFCYKPFEHQVGVLRLYFNLKYNLDWMSTYSSYAIGYFNSYLNEEEFKKLCIETNSPFLYLIDIADTSAKDSREVDMCAIIKIINHLTF